MQWKPHVTVAAIARRDDRFLIVEEEENDLIVLNQPAGHLDQGETLVDAVKREVLEETAWDFLPEAITGIYLHHNPRTDITYLRVCFYGSCSTHHPEQQLDHGILRALWMDRDELVASRDRLRSKMVLRCIDDFLTGKRYPLEILNHYIK